MGQAWSFLGTKNRETCKVSGFLYLTKILPSGILGAGNMLI